MAEKVFHIKYKDIYRIVNPGYDPGPGPEYVNAKDGFGNGTYGGIGKVMVDVIVGDEKAMVIDTGNGDVDLKT